MARPKRSDGDAGQQTDEKVRTRSRIRRGDPQKRQSPASRAVDARPALPAPAVTLRPMSEQDTPAAPKADAGAEQPSSTGLLLALATLVWMGAMLWSARATITGREDAEMEVTSTAYALP